MNKKFDFLLLFDSPQELYKHKKSLTDKYKIGFKHCIRRTLFLVFTSLNYIRETREI